MLYSINMFSELVFCICVSAAIIFAALNLSKKIHIAILVNISACLIYVFLIFAGLNYENSGPAGGVGKHSQYITNIILSGLQFVGWAAGAAIVLSFYKKSYKFY